MARDTNLDGEIGIFITLFAGFTLLFFTIKACFTGCKRIQKNLQPQGAEYDSPPSYQESRGFQYISAGDHDAYPLPSAPPYYEESSAPLTHPEYYAGAYNPSYVASVLSQRAAFGSMEK